MLTLTIAATAVLAACGRSVGNTQIDVAAHREAVLEWRAGRRERLLAPYGFLTLTGLHWLSPGTYSFGSAAMSDVVFPTAAAETIGQFVVTSDGVTMNVIDGTDVTSNGEPVISILIADDTTESPVTIEHGTLAWTVVKRDDKFAVRLRDFENPARAAFGELPYYDIDPKLQVGATLKRYDQPRIVNVGTVVEGLGWNPQSPGVVEFEINGEVFELEAYESGDELFYVFGDKTNADETYGAGRFLYSAVPDGDGKLKLDFNQSYSPPCAFNDFATCPVASPRNRLPIRLEVGEKFDPALYHGSAH